MFNRLSDNKWTQTFNKNQLVQMEMILTVASDEQL